MLRKIVSAFTLCLTCLSISAQSFPNGSYNFNGDPAAAYNKYLVYNNERKFVKIGPYRVLGSYYLFGEDHIGDLYSVSEKAFGLKLSYNAYNQEVKFLSAANPNNPLVKEYGTLDSFFLRKDSLVKEDMLFIFGGHLNSKDKSYYRRVGNGNKNYVLYKKYVAAIKQTSNIAEADLREFEIEVSYYYYNKEKKSLNKLRTTFNALKKDLAFIPNVENLLDRDLLQKNPETALLNIFEQ